MNPADPSQPPAPLLRPWLGGLLLVVGCLFIYRASLGFGFVMFDDDVNFVFNRDFGPLNAGRLRWIATEHTVMMRYVPVGWLACCAIASIGGLDPFWFHLASVLLHAAACVVLCGVLARLARLLGIHQAKLGGAPILGLLPFALAAWWGWHPLRVETVAWVTTLIYLLATLLGLLSLQLFLSSLGGTLPRRGTLAASLIFFIAALFSHPAAISFLPLLSACAAVGSLQDGGLREMCKDRIRLRRLGMSLLPFMIAGVAGFAAAITARQFGSIVPHDPTPTLAEFDLGQRVAQASAAATHFIAKIIWPADLNPAYPLLENVRPLAPRFLLSMMACAALALLGAALLWRRARAGLFALATLAAFVPVLGLQEHPFFPSDRYTHIAMIGLALGVLAAVSASHRLRIITARILPAAIVMVLPPWIAMSRRQLTLWSSDDTLFDGITAIQTSSPTRDFYSTRLLNIHLHRGEISQARLQLERIKRDGAPDSTLRDLSEKITATETERGPAPYAALLITQARYATAQGDTRQAVERLRRALSFSPRSATARFSLGMLLARDGDARGAVSQLLWLRANPAERLPPAAMQNLRASVAAAFRGQGQDRLARLVEALP